MSEGTFPQNVRLTPLVIIAAKIEIEFSYFSFWDYGKREGDLELVIFLIWDKEQIKAWFFMVLNNQW